MVQSCCKLGSISELFNGRCRLVVVALETGGRWSNEAVDFIWQLTQAKARSAILHDAANGIGVGAPVDEDVEHSVRVFCGRWWSRTQT